MKIVLLLFMLIVFALFLPAGVRGQSSQIQNAAPTLAPVFLAYCDAWGRNDGKALRKVYSSETLWEFKREMRKERIRSLLEYLEMDRPSPLTCSARDEVLEGDTGFATLIYNKYPNGIEIMFVKENGAWKLTNKSPALEKLRHKSPSH